MSDSPSATDPFAEELAANARYAQDYVDDGVPGAAGKGLAVLTCMDSRIDPLQVLGLSRGDAKIMRNAGARVSDEVLRTLVLAVHLLGVQRVLVLAHTMCKMASATDAQVHQSIADAGALDTRSLEFGTVADQTATLRHDVQRIRSWPYLPAGLPVLGGIYDVSTGRISVAVPG